jgi:hypothetical protein
MARIGYPRVSMIGQPEEQTDALRAAGCAQVFTGHGFSGAKASLTPDNEYFVSLRGRAPSRIEYRSPRSGRLSAPRGAGRG